MKKYVCFWCKKDIVDESEMEKIYICKESCSTPATAHKACYQDFLKMAREEED
ncbi:MAG: hypothetical protein ACFE68_05090 [Candidatus Hodarchaeota archaeon]